MKEKLMFLVADAWRAAFPGASAGVLVMEDVSNPDRHPGLDEQKALLENALRSRFAAFDKSALGSLPHIQAYTAYYKRFDKSYHVLLQLESLIFKGKSIPRVAALVEAMFMAELKNQLLTAGHDLDQVHLPVTLDVSKGGEHYTLLNGKEQALKPGDMMMSDQQGIISSILYGPDLRTRITVGTQRALFTVYAPVGVGEQAVEQHLQDIRTHVMWIAPGARVEELRVYSNST